MFSWIFDNIFPWVGKEILSASVISSSIAAGATVLVAFRSMAVADRAVKVGFFQTSIKDAYSEGYLVQIRDRLKSIDKNISIIILAFQDTTNEGSLRAVISINRKDVVQHMLLLNSLLRAPGNKYQECCALLSEYNDRLISGLEDLEGFPDISRGKLKLTSIQEDSSVFRAHLFELFQDCSHRYMASRINAEFPEVTMMSLFKKAKPLHQG